MNSIILAIIIIPIIEIYLFIKIGSEIGAFTTIFLIFSTAIIGLYYAKYEGINTLRSGFQQLSKNETPAYEVISGAAIAFAALLLIIPLTRGLFFRKLLKKFKKDKTSKKNFIEGEFEDIDDNHDRKI